MLRQVFGIGQVAIMGQGNAVGGVNIERRRFCLTGTSGGRVTHMSQTNSAFEFAYISGAKNVSDKSIRFALIDAEVVTSHDASSVLPSVLQYR